MSIDFRCADCGTETQVADDLAGKTVKCRECHSLGRVPSMRVLSPVIDPAQVQPVRGRWKPILIALVGAIGGAGLTFAIIVPLHFRSPGSSITPEPQATVEGTNLSQTVIRQNAEIARLKENADLAEKSRLATIADARRWEVILKFKYLHFRAHMSKVLESIEQGTVVQDRKRLERELDWINAVDSALGSKQFSRLHELCLTEFDEQGRAALAPRYYLAVSLWYRGHKKEAHVSFGELLSDPKNAEFVQPFLD